MRYPGASWDPLGPQTEPRIQAHDVACLHTMVGSLAGVSAYFHQGGYSGLESHFGLGHDGAVLQWQDCAFEADANYEGNHRVVSMETADTGPGFDAWSGSDVPAWTPAQVDAIVAWLLWVTSPETHAACPADWLCHQHGIPRVLSPDTLPTRRGIGYHRQGIDPWRKPGAERWSVSTGKVCPGDRRITQLVDVIIPRVQASTAKPQLLIPPQEDNMVIVITAPDKPPRAVAFGKLIGFKPDPTGGSQYSDFRAAVIKAKVPIVDWVCDVEQYDAVCAVYGTPTIVVS